MSGAIDTKNIWRQVQSPAQKQSLPAAGSHVHHTGFARRRTPTQQHLQHTSKRHSRLRGSRARSSKDDRSNKQRSPDPSEQQGVGRKQFLKALSGEQPLFMLDGLCSLYAREHPPKARFDLETQFMVLCRQPLGALPQLRVTGQSGCSAVTHSP